MTTEAERFAQVELARAQLQKANADAELARSQLAELGAGKDISAGAPQPAITFADYQNARTPEERKAVLAAMEAQPDPEMHSVPGRSVLRAREVTQ